MREHYDVHDGIAIDSDVVVPGGVRACAPSINATPPFRLLAVLRCPGGPCPERPSEPGGIALHLRRVFRRRTHVPPQGLRSISPTSQSPHESRSICRLVCESLLSGRGPARSEEGSALQRPRRPGRALAAQKASSKRGEARGVERAFLQGARGAERREVRGEPSCRALAAHAVRERERHE